MKLQQIIRDMLKQHLQSLHSNLNDNKVYFRWSWNTKDSETISQPVFGRLFNSHLAEP